MYRGDGNTAEQVFSLSPRTVSFTMSRICKFPGLNIKLEILVVAPAGVSYARLFPERRG